MIGFLRPVNRDGHVRAIEKKCSVLQTFRDGERKKGEKKKRKTMSSLSDKNDTVLPTFRDEQQNFIIFIIIIIIIIIIILRVRRKTRSPVRYRRAHVKDPTAAGKHCPGKAL